MFELNRFDSFQHRHLLKIPPIEVLRFSRKVRSNYLNSILRFAEKTGVDGQQITRELNKCKTATEVFALYEHYRRLQPPTGWTIQELTEPENIDPIENLPEPIVPGNADIVPLLTRGGLLDEARHMNHCIGNNNYFHKAKSGEIALYRVIHPERATLEVIQSDPLKIGQLVTAGNKKVSEETYRYVSAYVAQYN